MTGTPSGTTTAYDNGNTRWSFEVGTFLHEPNTAKPRGYVGRKLNAKLRSEEHESHMRRQHDGRGRVGVQSPKVIRIISRICGRYVELKSRALPREVCLSVWNYRKDQTREAERSTMDRQKSAESISCRRTATKEEHKGMNRNGAIDV